MPLLEAATPSHYDSLNTSVSNAIKSIAKYLLQVSFEPAGIPHEALARLQEAQGLSTIRNCLTKPAASAPAVARIDFAFAFDAIAGAEGAQLAAYLDLSVFDRNLEPIVLDVAPYVRGIVSYDSRLQKQRLKLSNLISEGGRGPKRMRTTRAAISALEGGTRSTTRKERWFKADLNTTLVMHTAGEGWNEATLETTENSKIRKGNRTRKSLGDDTFSEGEADDSENNGKDGLVDDPDELA